ncbi:putative response regulator and transcription factor RR-A-type family [Lupinus albus]|uniref:Putative response regulator and transcription factor RR-A-type family n=1 Tax=Lupinus albus TaxID=3870 RepID=A0A6A4PZP7_LUPAL|nr:putative response regulator and transcription factor RR-A-type family [Lupinus albus]
MVCTANDLQGWKDFPKGLKVLLLDGDINSAAETKAKLEAMDYNISSFSDENEALSACSSRPQDFHVAVVEVSTSSSQGGFKFLENAKDLPTIMTSKTHCLSTMMKCIALGAVEFLNKPLSEDNLRNIWQHVVHKAFNAGASVLPESLKPVRESVEPVLQLQTENGQRESKMLIDVDNVSKFSYNDHEHITGSDKYPAPSTPQLKQGERLLDGGDCQDQTNCSTEKESGEHDEDSKSVDTSCENLNTESTTQPIIPEKTPIKGEEDIADGCKGEIVVSLNPHNRNLSKAGGNSTSPNKASVRDSCEIKANRKKMKVDWTPELHKKFVHAVEQLGVDQAIPSRILELMKVEGLTRHNVASHLQKYRIQKRQIVPREEDRRWTNRRDQMQRSYCAQRPIMAYPPYHFNHTLSSPPAYPMWGQPGNQTAGVRVWGPLGYPLCQPFPTVHADAWGFPVLPPPQAPFSYTHNMVGLHNAKAVDYRFDLPQNSFEHHPAEEVVDKVVKEAMNKPWLPLPLGLKPPSADSVLAELSKQGVSNITKDSSLS